MKSNDNNKVSKVRNFLYEAHFIFFCLTLFQDKTTLKTKKTDASTSVFLF